MNRCAHRYSRGGREELTIRCAVALLESNLAAAAAEKAGPGSSRDSRAIPAKDSSVVRETVHKVAEP